MVSSLGWAIVQLARRLLPALLPSMSAEIGFSAAESGILLTVLSASYASMQYPSGRFSDRFSRKGPLVAGIGCTVVGCLVLGWARSYVALLLGVLILGVGAGSYPTSARALVSDLFSERRGEAFGLHTASGDLGSAMAAGVAVLAVTLATWRAAFVPTALCLVLIGGVVHLGSRGTYQYGRFSLGLRDSVSTLLGTRSMRWLLVAYVLYVIAVQGVIGFLPALLQFEKGMSPAVAGLGYAIFFVVGIAARPLAGYLSDRIARGPVAGVSTVLAAGALLVTVYTRSPVTALAAVGVFAVGTKAYPPVMQALLMDLFSERSAGRDLGAMRTVYIGLGSLGPAYVGFVSARYDYGTAFIGLVACFLASAVVTLLLSLDATGGA